jgi:hypothetical protein
MKQLLLSGYLGILSLAEIPTYAQNNQSNTSKTTMTNSQLTQTNQPGVSAEKGNRAAFPYPTCVSYLVEAVGIAQI